jgi:hypothetical protein
VKKTSTGKSQNNNIKEYIAGKIIIKRNDEVY